MKRRRCRPRLKLPAVAPLGLAAMIVLPEPKAQDSSQFLRWHWPTDGRPAVALTASGLRVSSHAVSASRAGLARGGRAGAEIKLLAHGITCKNEVAPKTKHERADELHSSTKPVRLCPTIPLTCRHDFW